MSTIRTAPSGWWHAPRPATSPAHCCSRRMSLRRPVPRCSSVSAVEIAASPNRQGPHCRALARARYAASRATSATPQHRGTHRRQHPAAERHPGSPERHLVERQVLDPLPGQPAAAVPAEEHGLRGLPAGQPPSSRAALDRRPGSQLEHGAPPRGQHGDQVRRPVLRRPRTVRPARCGPASRRCAPASGGRRRRGPRSARGATRAPPARRTAPARPRWTRRSGSGWARWPAGPAARPGPPHAVPAAPGPAPGAARARRRAARRPTRSAPTASAACASPSSTRCGRCTAAPRPWRWPARPRRRCRRPRAADRCAGSRPARVCHFLAAGK